ncbi:MAG TPA: metallophosphoesterase, partial [Clostridia bacterium]|nr:metallophosphoesterase [Clostridia bacterium]
LVFAPHLIAAGRRRVDEDSWALFSDIHIAGDRARVLRNTNMAQNFEAVSREVLALPKRPAGVFITGDCALNSGETADYATLSGLLEPLRAGGMPIHLGLGNHDNRERFWQALEARKAARRPVTDKHVGMVKTRRVNWFLLDSLESTNSTPGLLGQSQLEWLAAELDANRKKPALVLVHHNPGAHNGALKDTERLFEVIRPRRQVKAYIYGHTHRWSVEKDASGIHLVNLPPVAYIFREGDPAGWVHAAVEKQGMRLELRCIDKGHRLHGSVRELSWRA